jgi:hypothetical protein
VGLDQVESVELVVGGVSSMIQLSNNDKIGTVARRDRQAISRT